MKISPIDIRKLLTELWLSGLSDEKIGRAIGTTAATVNRLRLGVHRSTNTERAAKIANFHKSHFRDRNGVKVNSLPCCKEAAYRPDQRQKRSRMVGTR